VGLLWRLSASFSACFQHLSASFSIFQHLSACLKVLKSAEKRWRMLNGLSFSAAFQHAFSSFQLAFSSLQKLKGLKTRDPGHLSAMLTEAEKLDTFEQLLAAFQHVESMKNSLSAWRTVFQHEEQSFSMKNSLSAWRTVLHYNYNERTSIHSNKTLRWVGIHLLKSKAILRFNLNID